MTNEYPNEALSLQDEDRLPWLEAVDEDQDPRASNRKLIGFIIAALAALALVVLGISAMRHRAAGPGDGDGKLIAAPEGDYKVRPDAPGGMKVEGQGDSAFATSEGAEAHGKIDLNATPETPVAGEKAKSAVVSAATGAKPSVTAAVPAAGGKLVATPPPHPVTPASKPGAGAGLVQLGAYGSEARANEAWVLMTKRFAYLAPLAKSVEAFDTGSGTVYRLRANAGGDATTVCGKLRVAGESCLIVN